MAKIVILNPHDPLPARRRDAVLLRRFGEDDKSAIVTELDFAGAHPVMYFDAALAWGDILRAAYRSTVQHGLTHLYVVNRTAGPREAEVVLHHGDHGAFAGVLEDVDVADGVRGATMLDLPSRTEFVP